MDSVPPSLYAPLDQDKQEIRLLTLLASTEYDSPIACTLHTVSLDTTLQYECLSYTWEGGGPQTSLPVAVNGRMVLVMPNLEHALRRLRQNKDRVMWVDAVCIDQDNDEERGHQVAIMGRIYSHAAHTIAWLGEEVEEGDKRYAWMHMRRGKRMMKVAFRVLETIVSDKHDKEITAALASGDYSVTADLKCARASLKALSNRRWWSRVWTVQETILSASMTLKCGILEIPWHVIPRSLDVYEKHRMTCCDEGLWLPNIYRKRALELGNASQRFGTGWGLTQVCNHFSTRDAKDKRDKIFGYYSLLHRRDWPVQPDYQQTVENLYRRVTVHQLEQGFWRPLVDSRKSSRPTGLSSWSANYGFVATPVKTNTVGEPTRRRYNKFQHHHRKSMTFKNYPDNIISLEGRRVDNVKFAKNRLSRDDVRMIIAQKRYHHTGESIELAMMRTLSQDCETQARKSRQDKWFRRTNEADRRDAELRAQSKKDGLAIFQTSEELFTSDTNSNPFFPTDGNVIVTEHGYIGLSYTSIEAGDLAYLFDGVPCAFFLREAQTTAAERRVTGNRPCYEIISHGVVHGFYDGEIYDMPLVEAEEIFLK